MYALRRMKFRQIYSKQHVHPITIHASCNCTTPPPPPRKVNSVVTLALSLSLFRKTIPISSPSLLLLLPRRMLYI